MARMEIDRRAFVASLGGASVVSLMSHEARAEALEHYMTERIEGLQESSSEDNGGNIYSTPAKARGTGLVFRMAELAEMPPAPTLMDFMHKRFLTAHGLRSATHAIQTGQPERTVFACLVHDVTQSLCRSDHGWWGGQLFEPYVDERISWGIRHHQALRFFPDPEVGYEYPEMYNRIFGVDYEPDPYLKQTHIDARAHKHYMEARLITMNDEYGFDEDIDFDPVETFEDVIGRQFRQPKEGLGFDGSPVAHMWRTIINPNRPL